jgi:hypothetical protein
MSLLANHPVERKLRKTKTRVFQIRFVIGEDEYAVSALQPHPEVARKAFRFRKLTGDADVLDSRETEFGLECDCRGFTAHHHCKHCETLAAAEKVFAIA